MWRRLCLIYLSLSSVQAQADDVSVSLTVDRPAIALGESFEASVQVSGPTDGARPQIEGLDDFEVLGQQESSQVQIINGTMNRLRTFSFSLSPKRSGALSLGPARLSVEGLVYSSVPLTIKVAEAGQAVAADAPYRVTATIDEKSPYVGQALVYRFRFYVRAGIANAQLGLPDFSGFIKEQLGKQQESQVTENGVPWQVTEICYLLLPTQAGPTKILPTQLTIDVVAERGGQPRSPFDDSFFGNRQTRRVRLATDSFSLDVKALPTVGRPAQFSGLVGQFKISAALSQAEVAFGESLSLKATVTGQGNIQDAKLPKPELGNLKAYEDKPKLQAGAQGDSYGGTKELSWALVAQQPGSWDIGPLVLNYFNPTTGHYEEARSAPLPLKVTGSAAVTPPTAALSPKPGAQEQIKVLGSDLQSPKVESTIDVAAPTERLVLGLWLLVTAIIWFAAFWQRTIRQRLQRDPGARRRTKALQILQAGLTSLSPDEFFSRAPRLVKDFLSARWDLPAVGLTAAEVEQRLAGLGLRADTAASLGRILTVCEAASYGGGQSKESAVTLQQELYALTYELDKAGAKR